VVVPLKRLILLVIPLNGNGYCHCVAGVAGHPELGVKSKHNNALAVKPGRKVYC
jgi:hypothetical protein